MPYVNVQLRRHLPSLRGGYHIASTGTAVYVRPSGTECASRAPAQTPAHALNWSRTPSRFQETRCQKIPNCRINGSNFSRYSENQKPMEKSKSRHSTASRPAAGTATRPSTPGGNFLPSRPRKKRPFVAGSLTSAGHEMWTFCKCAWQGGKNREAEATELPPVAPVARGTPLLGVQAGAVRRSSPEHASAP